MREFYKIKFDVKVTIWFDKCPTHLPAMKAGFKTFDKDQFNFKWLRRNYLKLSESSKSFILIENKPFQTISK